jgi:hypothetical protein
MSGLVRVAVATALVERGEDRSATPYHHLMSRRSSSFDIGLSAGNGPSLKRAVPWTAGLMPIVAQAPNTDYPGAQMCPARHGAARAGRAGRHGQCNDRADG